MALLISEQTFFLGIVAPAHNVISWGSLEQGLLHMLLLAAGAILAVTRLCF